MSSKQEAGFLLELLDMFLGLAKSHGWWESELHKGESLKEFQAKFPAGSEGWLHYRNMAYFWECVGVLTRNRLINQELIFNTFFITPDWEKAEKIVKDEQEQINPLLGENFEWLAKQKMAWVQKRLKGETKRSRN